MREQSLGPVASLQEQPWIGAEACGTYRSVFAVLTGSRSVAEKPVSPAPASSDASYSELIEDKQAH
jgi:hypothetical protein